MKSNEIMIGDWVSVLGIPMRIAELGIVRAGLLDENGEMSYNSYAIIEPIPLTADLLYDNLFTPTLEDDRIYEYCYGGHYVVKVQKDGDFINLADEKGSHDDEDFDCDLVAMISATCGDRLAVHNLQHFLTENGIDIKIEVLKNHE